jgi:hypothetical protein
VPFFYKLIRCACFVAVLLLHFSVWVFEYTHNGHAAGGDILQGTAAAVTRLYFYNYGGTIVSIYIGRFIARNRHFCWFFNMRRLGNSLLVKIDENLPLRLSKTTVVFTGKRPKRGP